MATLINKENSCDNDTNYKGTTRGIFLTMRIQFKSQATE